MERDVFTTFEAARYCQVHFETIKNWIRRGRLQAYRTPGGHYRISRENLEKLMRDNNFPVVSSDGNPARTKVLIVSDDAASREKISGDLNIAGNFEVFTAKDSLTAGFLLSGHLPECVVINGAYNQEFVTTIRNLRKGAKVISFSKKSSDTPPEIGADAYAPIKSNFAENVDKILKG